MKYIFLFFILPTLSHAGWTKSAASGLCQGELFASSETKPITWVRGTDSVSVCAFEIAESGKILKINEAFEVKAVLGGKKTIVASEAEVGAQPIQLEFGDTDIKITRFQETDGPAAYTQTITCGAKCELSKASCALKPHPKAKQIIERLEAAFKKAASPQGKLKVWENYFFEGPDIADGKIIVSEAILGNKAAKALALNAPGADAGLSEAVAEIGLTIERIHKICRR